MDMKDSSLGAMMKMFLTSMMMMMMTTTTENFLLYGTFRKDIDSKVILRLDRFHLLYFLCWIAFLMIFII